MRVVEVDKRVIDQAKADRLPVLFVVGNAVHAGRPDRVELQAALPPALWSKALDRLKAIVAEAEQLRLCQSCGLDPDTLMDGCCGESDCPLAKRKKGRR